MSEADMNLAWRLGANHIARLAAELTPCAKCEYGGNFPCYFGNVTHPEGDCRHFEEADSDE